MQQFAIKASAKTATPVVQCLSLIHYLWLFLYIVATYVLCNDRLSRNELIALMFKIICYYFHVDTYSYHYYYKMTIIFRMATTKY